MLKTNPTRQLAALLGAGLLALVAACGGGGGGSTGSTQPTNYSAGPIAGFGSIIVNGVRWDDSSASVTDDDGVSHSSSELKLGMVVQIDGHGVDASTGKGKANEIHFGSEVKGPISAVAASGFTVFGITVVVDASTVFDPSISGGLAGLAANDVVEVHGLFDAANNKLTATRVEKEDSVGDFRMRGVVSALNTTDKTFKLGTETISYALLGALPSWVVDGVQAKVRMQTTQVAGAWVATKLRPVGTSIGDRAEAEVEGTVSAFTSAAAFEVNGLKVDASKATFQPGSDAVVMGAHVEVKGAIVDGVLVATLVKVEDEHSGGHGGGDNGGTPREFELHGAISAVNGEAKTFSLRGLTVNYGGTVTFKDGTVANLVDGANLEVKGTLSADKTTIDATLIDFDR
jgi:hypothetical protein